MSQVKENQTPSNGSLGLLKTQELECKQCGCTHATAYELGRTDATGLFHEAVETIRKLQAQISVMEQDLFEAKDSIIYIRERHTEAKAERDRLASENERLKQHVRDLNADLEGTIDDCQKHHGEAA